MLWVADGCGDVEYGGGAVVRVFSAAACAVGAGERKGNIAFGEVVEALAFSAVGIKDYNSVSIGDVGMDADLVFEMGEDFGLESPEMGLVECVAEFFYFEVF